MSHDAVPPVVYLLGDSIAAGYAPAVERLLAREVLVQLRPSNGEDSRNILAAAPAWLKGQRFSLIHFNCGLHDIKRPRGEAGIQVPLEEYQANLPAIIGLLRDHAETLIWARTTPVVDGQRVPEKSFDRFNRAVDAYNRAADRVMAESGIPINDLHGVVISNGLERCLNWDGVHMSAMGYEVLGKSVSAAILRQLARWQGH